MGIASGWSKSAPGAESIGPAREWDKGMRLRRNVARGYVGRRDCKEIGRNSARRNRRRIREKSMSRNSILAAAIGATIIGAHARAETPGVTTPK